MRSKKFAICALVLAGALFVSGASASAPHPAQMGDPGGARAKEIEQALKNNTSPPSSQKAAPAPVSQDMPAQGQGQQGAIMNTEPGATGGDSGSADENDIPVISAPKPPENTEYEKPVTLPADISTQALDWFGAGFDLIKKNKNITVYDVKTGITWKAIYINGRNHADIIPASAEDTIKLANNKITGDYVRRPVVVTIGGTKFAGSMYAEGHGTTNYASYFKGVMCIHFTGSMTHGTQKVDKDHQNAIQEALKH